MKKLFLIFFILTACAQNNDTTNTYYIEYVTPVVDEQPSQDTNDDQDSEQDEEENKDGCNTTLVGFHGHMDQDDKNALKTAKKRCGFYYPDAPCLVKFIKKEKQVYHAICGANNAEN